MNKMVRENIVTKLELGGGGEMRTHRDQMGWERVRKLFNNDHNQKVKVINRNTVKFRK